MRGRIPARLGDLNARDVSVLEGEFRKWTATRRSFSAGTSFLNSTLGRIRLTCYKRKEKKRKEKKAKSLHLTAPPAMIGHPAGVLNPRARVAGFPFPVA